MVGCILALVLLGIALLAMALQKTYAAIGAKELRRRARAKDPVALVLYRAVAYGASLRVVLWLVVVVTAAASLVIFSRVSDPVLAFLLVAAVLAYGFIWMPARRATDLGLKIAVWLTPAVAWFLDKASPLFDALVRFIRKHRPVSIHTGLYDRDDLLALIETQKHQPESRISVETLELLQHTLTFGDKLVGGCMVPCRAVRAVPATQPIGPALINELHQSGHSRFPVFAGKSLADEGADDAAPGGIVGILYLRDLVTLKKTGTAAAVMYKQLYYVHEDHPLEQVLDAFLKTHHHLFIVVNSFEEFVGIITIEDILEQILGAKIVDEFDQYDDMRAVAAHQAATIHHEHKQDGSEITVQPVQPDDDGQTVAETNPYPQATLKHVIYEAGFRGEALEVAFAVAMAESGGKPDAHNDDASTGDDSYGLFQINMLGDMGPERRKLYKLKKNADLFDPAVNARVAYQLSEAGKNWQPWTMFTNGSYKQYYSKKSNHKL